MNIPHWSHPNQLVVDWSILSILPLLPRIPINKGVFHCPLTAFLGVYITFSHEIFLAFFAPFPFFLLGFPVSWIILTFPYVSFLGWLYHQSFFILNIHFMFIGFVSLDHVHHDVPWSSLQCHRQFAVTSWTVWTLDTEAGRGKEETGSMWENVWIQEIWIPQQAVTWIIGFGVRRFSWVRRAGVKAVSGFYQETRCFGNIKTDLCMPS